SVRRARARRARARRPAPAARSHRLGRPARHRRLRERARLPVPELGATADRRDPHRPSLLARAGLRRDLRLRARGGPARRPRLDGLPRDHGRDRRRRARSGRRARPTGPRGAPLMAVLLALASGVLFGAMTVALLLALRRAPGTALATLATTASA